MNQELLPCPFCGGRAKVYRGEPIKTNPNLPSFVFIFCDTGCRNRTREFYDEAEAVESWNRRVVGNQINTCDKCKHWEEGWVYATKREQKTDNTRGVCSQIGYAGIRIEALDEMACIYFNNADDVKLVTHAHFGCNQFEAKQ